MAKGDESSEPTIGGRRKVTTTDDLAKFLGAGAGRGAGEKGCYGMARRCWGVHL